MSAIYKYPLTLGRTELALPSSATVLSAQIQDSQIYLWVRLDPEAPAVARIFETFPTGNDAPEDPRAVYISTVQAVGAWGSLVWHVFEVANVGAA